MFSYDVYNRGAEQDVFLKNPDGSTYIGAVWPGYTVFPDWHSPKVCYKVQLYQIIELWLND